MPVLARSVMSPFPAIAHRPRQHGSLGGPSGRGPGRGLFDLVEHYPAEILRRFPDRLGQISVHCCRVVLVVFADQGQQLGIIAAGGGERCPTECGGRHRAGHQGASRGGEQSAS